jgi:MOSC domain-containing protein YiiM
VADRSVVDLIEVAVGTPTVIGRNRDGDVLSGIVKRRVQEPEILVGLTNLAGDAQADLRVHGGPDKAVYCYPREHRAFWHAEIGYDRAEAPFGENLSVEGALETDVCIGDTWRWGTALLQVSQPRWPCYKLALHVGQDDIIKRFIDSGRSGWYLRVLEEGLAPTSGPITIEHRDPARLPVSAVVSKFRGDADPAIIQAVNAHPALTASWRR